MRAVDWLPVRLARSLRKFYSQPDVRPPYHFGELGDDGRDMGPLPDFQSLVQRGRFPDAGKLGDERFPCARTTDSERIRTVALLWRLALLESDATIDGPAPANAVQFRVELFHEDASHCAAVMDKIAEDIRPQMVSLDSIYDKDDDATVQEFRLQACVAEFSIMAHDLPTIEYA